MTDTSKKLSSLHEGSTRYRDFIVDRRVEIPEICCTLYELVHEPTGAQVIHLAADDPENVFCIALRTPPSKSDGVAHILEHTVLCGSKKYPVKDPFFAMGRRSLNTFMNALTWPDFTCYPAASQVHQDFYNLFSVYLDAVFHPNLLEKSFQQEGHRLEFSQPNDPQSPLTFRGVVYNEMKGAMSSAGARLSETLHEQLLPDTPYGVNSGGDPKVIPELTYQQLLDFHHEHYHPSRALFIFYGDMPLEGHLDYLEENCLRDTRQIAPLAPAPKQSRFSTARRIEVPYPLAPTEDPKERTIISFSWLTCPITAQLDILALTVLQVAIMGTDAAPLKRALLESGLCKQASISFDEEMSEVPASVVAKGCETSSADALEEVLRSSLRAIAETGISEQQIDSALHQVELHRSEITGDYYPHGLQLCMRLVPLKYHGGNLQDGLVIHSMFDKLRQLVADNPRYFSELIERYFLNNPHFVRVVLYPDQELTVREDKEEQARLKEIQTTLSDDEATLILQQAAELSAFQEDQDSQDLSVLPAVHVSDIPHHTKDFSLTHQRIGDVELYHHDCFTNGLVYCSVAYPLGNLAANELSAARLFSTLAPQVGCGGRDYRQNLEYIQEHTGGIGMGLELNSQAHDRLQYNPQLHLGGKALYRKADKLLPLIGDMIRSLDFSDVKRLKELLLKQYTAIQSAINSRGLQYAINLSASGLTAQTAIAQHWYGLEYYRYITDLVNDFDSHAEQLVATLEGLKTRLLDLEGAHLLLSCDAIQRDKLISKQLYTLDNIATRRPEPWSSPLTPTAVQPQGRTIATPVAFTAKTFSTVSYVHPAAPALALAGFIFENKTLHPRVREQGGAYGVHSGCSPVSGNFSFTAYRDPNIATTFTAFEEAIAAVAAGNFDESDLEEAKLEKIQGLDSPTSPGSRAELQHSWMSSSMPVELRQAFREKLLTVTKEEIISAVAEHLVPNFDKGSYVVFAGKELLETENARLKAMGKPELEILPVV